MMRGLRHLGVMMVALATFGCAATDSLIEQGQRVQTGKGRIDGFFGEVLELRDKVKELDSDLLPLRQPLLDAYEMKSDTPLPVLMAETKKRVEKYKTFGVSASLRISPNPIVVIEKGDMGQDEADEVTLKAIQESAVRALATYREYAQLYELATRYDDQREGLMEQLDKAGDSVADPSNVQNEIVGAGRVLRDVQSKLLKDMRAASLMLVALSEAVDTGGAAAHETACEEAMAHWKPARKAFRGGGKRMGGFAPKAGGFAPKAGGSAPAPAPKKSGGGDFDM